jgi:hypothetical protein
MHLVERDAAQAHGPFTLFALFERSDAFGRWDVVVSAPWLTEDRDGILTITQPLVRHFSSDEIARLSRVVPLSTESDFVKTVLRLAPLAKDGFIEIRDTLYGVELERAYILAAQDPHLPGTDAGE